MSEEAADEADDSELDALTLLRRRAGRRRPTGQRRRGLSSKTYLSGSLLMPLSETVADLEKLLEGTYSLHLLPIAIPFKLQ